MKQKYFPGDKTINNQGFEVTIIDVIKGVKHNSLLVEFNDQDHTRKYCDVCSFKSGSVKNPKYKRAKDSRIIRNESKRVGAENVNYLNEPIKVIAYRSATDIDVEFQDEYKGVVTTTWKQFNTGHVRNPNQATTGIIKHPSNFKDLTGKTYNNLLVLGWDTNPPDTESIKKKATGLWKCLCLKCGEITWANTSDLKIGTRKSCRNCGYKSKIARKYTIEYDLSGEYGIGYTYNTKHPFFFDLEDYDLIKDYSWMEEPKNGYIIACKNNTDVLLHRLIMGVTDPNVVIDHIKHERFDNRKKMLRATTDHKNTMNRKLSKNNTSGKTGVSFEKGKWRAYIWYNGKTIHLGSYINKEDAIEARLEAEDKYFGEYSYHNSMLIGDINERKNI